MRSIPLKLAVLTLALVAVVSVHAQHYTVPAVNCGRYTANFYCPNMRVVGANGVSTSVFYEPKYNGNLNSVNFKGRDGLGSFAVTSVIDTQNSTIHTQTVSAVWYDAAHVQYNLTSTITYQTYYSRGGGGIGGGGAGTYWNVLSGTMDVVKIEY